MDIVAGRFDAGVWLGDQVAKDMIAERIGPDLRRAVVATPGYFSRRAPPQVPQDLTAHDCINLRLPTYGGLLPWEFAKDGHALNVRVDGQWVFNSSTPRLRAALAGFGIAMLPEDMVQPHVADGSLICVLEDGCQPFAGYLLTIPAADNPRRRLRGWRRRCGIGMNRGRYRLQNRINPRRWPSDSGFSVWAWRLEWPNCVKKRLLVGLRPCGNAG